MRIEEKFIPVRLEALTPVHIGAGKDTMLSPLEYQIHHEENGEYWLYTVDVDAWLNSLENPLEIAEKFEKLPLIEVWKLVKNQLDKSAFVLSKSKTSQEIYNKYLDRLLSAQSSNEVAVATRNPLNQAMIIPGSSIKGAIRTAIIDKKDNGGLKKATNLDSTTSNSTNTAYDNELMRMFGKIDENTFQALKITDFELLPNASEFVTAIGIHKLPTKAQLPKPTCEVMPCNTENLYGRLMIGRWGQDKSYKYPLDTWSFESLLTTCNQYYKKRFLDELEKFYNKSNPSLSETSSFINKKMEYITQPQNSNAILLRVGHYSHIECVTVTQNAPSTPIRNGIRMPYGVTRTLANGIYPFGWVLLHKCSLDEYKEGRARHEAKSQELTNSFLLAKNNFFIQQAKKETAKKEKEAMEAEEARLKKEKELELSSLSKKEKAIYCFEHGDYRPNDIDELYENLDSHPKELQVKIAFTLRSYWQKEGRWEKPSKKQQPKIMKITELLKNQ